MAKRKASPEKNTFVKRTRVAEQAGPSSSSDIHVVKGVKRKVQQHGEGTTNPPKKFKRVDHISGDEEKVSSSLDTVKRKAAGDSKEPSKKKKAVAQDKTKHGDQNSVADQIHEFQARYVQEKVQLGEGGSGAVFAGYRIRDHFPVAIKRIPEENVFCKVRDENGKKLSLEVAIMLKLAAEADGSVGTSAPVSLLEWFDLGTELILVLERPVPAVELFQYIEENGGSLPEDKAKVILKQLVDAAKELEDKHIFHRDIKSENILIETSSDVPRVRIIDFGLSCFTKKRSLYRIFWGTPVHTPPEYYWRKEYRPGPTTVWQMGVVLYEVLHARNFDTNMFLRKELKFNKHLSTDCWNFLDACLTTEVFQRPTLEDLQLHPWLS